MKKFKNILKLISFNVFYYLWIILILSCITLMFDIKTAVVEFAFFLLLLGIYLWAELRRKKKLFRHIKNMDIILGDTRFKTLSEFNIPISIIQNDGYIQWNNNKFLELCNCDSVENMPITDYIAQFDINSYTLDEKKQNTIKYEVNHNGNYYVVVGDIIKTSPDAHDSEYFIILYWYDYTKYNSLKIKYHNEAFVSCVIVIDNYDDIMQSSTNTNKPELTAFIEKTLDNIANECNGIVRKYEKDRYFLYIQKFYLNEMIKNSFEFTDNFKNIPEGNKVAPTLSIGIGTEGETMSQNDSYAFAALDMALSRGGDQVVIKDNDQYHFFGGKTKEVEKRTRVKARIVSQALKDIISNFDEIIIMGHRYADVDVLGSALALNCIIKPMGKRCRILMETYNQTVERFLNKYGDQFKNLFINKALANEIVTPETLIFVVDTHKTTMVEESALLEVTKNIVVIDHHRKGTDFIKDALITYHEPYASSASELMTEILQYAEDIELDMPSAEALYSGIFMDTKNFTFKTGVRTFEAASYLKRCGVDTIEVKKLFQIDLNAFIKKWAIIENASTYKDKVAITTCVKNDDDMHTIVAQAADELLNITDISSSFVICDMGDMIIVSARSFGDINVQLITEKLGGGGHMTIAGAQLVDKNIDEVYTMLINAIDEYLE